MPVVRRACAIALLATSLAACTSGGDSPDAEPTPTITSLADPGAADLTVVRGDFCPRIDSAAVEDALGTAPDDSTTWRNGDRAALAPGVRDVAHEYGCAWTAADAAARAWVFAPPVTPAQARELGRTMRRTQGCDEVPDAARFGRRTVAVTCAGDTGPSTTYQGLFGDAWLSCSLTGTDAAAAARWCLTVVLAASAS